MPTYIVVGSDVLQCPHQFIPFFACGLFIASSLVLIHVPIWYCGYFVAILFLLFVAG